VNKYLKAIIYLSSLGIGLGVIVGSFLKLIIPYGNYINIEDKFAKTTFTPLKVKIKSPRVDFFNPRDKAIVLNTKEKDRMTKLILNWEKLLKKNKDLKASAYLYLIDEERFADLNSDLSLPSASSIKIPILIVLLSKIDTGEIKWDEKLELTKEVIAGGSGWMAYQPLGTSFPVYEAATEMIRVSDNTATNLLIKRIGGKEILNQEFKLIGLNNTQINNFLPDLEGTNITSTRDLARSIALVDSAHIISKRSRDLFREVMRTSRTNRMLPKGILQALGGGQKDIDYGLQIKGYMVYNKTGDIGISYSDTGLIQMPNNTRAVASFIVKGPFNDRRSPELIRDMASAMVPFLLPNE